MSNKYSKPYGKSVFESLTMISQFAISMLVPIGLMTFIGYKLDQRLQTWCFTIILFFVGAIAGGRNVYILVKKIMSKGTENTRESENRNNV